MADFHARTIQNRHLNFIKINRLRERNFRGVVIGVWGIQPECGAMTFLNFREGINDKFKGSDKIFRRERIKGWVIA